MLPTRLSISFLLKKQNTALTCLIYSFFFRIDYCKDWGGSNRVLSLVPLVWKAKHDSSRMREMTSDVLKKNQTASAPSIKLDLFLTSGRTHHPGSRVGLGWVASPATKRLQTLPPTTKGLRRRGEIKSTWIPKFKKKPQEFELNQTRCACASKSRDQVQGPR